MSDPKNETKDKPNSSILEFLLSGQADTTQPLFPDEGGFGSSYLTNSADFGFSPPIQNGLSNQNTSSGASIPSGFASISQTSALTLSSSPDKSFLSSVLQSGSKAPLLSSPQKQQNPSPQNHKRQPSGSQLSVGGQAPPLAAVASSDKMGSTKSNTHTFFGKLKQKEADPILRELAAFVSEFNLKAPPVIDDQARIVRNFLDNMQQKIEKHSLWKDASEDEMEGVVEGLEKFILTKIENLTFGAHIKDPENEELTKKMLQLQFITPTHLEIGPEFVREEAIQLAAKELNKMNEFKSPRDKQVCILNCCKVVASMIRQACKDPTGADVFLPLCIYVVLQARPANLHTNLRFIEKFRNPTKALSEAGYYFTLVLSAATFIKTINASQLSIDPKEFEEKMKEYAHQHPQFFNKRPAKNIEEEIKSDLDLPAQFINMNPDELRIGEIPALFNEYKLFFYSFHQQQKDLNRLKDEIKKLRIQIATNPATNNEK